MEDVDLSYFETKNRARSKDENPLQHSTQHQQFEHFINAPQPVIHNVEHEGASDLLEAVESFRPESSYYGSIDLPRANHSDSGAESFLLVERKELPALHSLSMSKSVVKVRKTHVQIEQRRRSRINDSFSRLRELLPRSRDKRSSNKANVMEQAVEYIEQLKKNAEYLQGQLNIAEHENSQLWGRVGKYEPGFKVQSRFGSGNSGM